MSHIDITFAIYPLPPTANTLDSAQRIRLMKSTDKIARILGTTPHVLEELRTPHVPAKSKGIQAGVKAIRRQGGLYNGYSSSSPSIDSDCGSPSTSSVSLSSSSELDKRPLPPVPSFPQNSRKVRKGKKVPPPLFLRLNTIPVSPTDARFVASSPSPPTPRRARTCAYPTTPSSSTPRTPSFSATPTTPHRSTRRSPSSKRTPSTPKTAKTTKATPASRPRTCSTSSKPVGAARCREASPVVGWRVESLRYAGGAKATAGTEAL
ncbi:hypothetical protein FIBSPDRAFT_867341, partial [Athelia psychrophila]